MSFYIIAQSPTQCLLNHKAHIIFYIVSRSVANPTLSWFEDEEMNKASPSLIGIPFIIITKSQTSVQLFTSTCTTTTSK